MITNFPIKVIAPIAINNQENFLELAKPGLWVVFRKIPKNKITNASEIPNITLFFYLIFSQLIKLINHLMMTHRLVFKIINKIILLLFSRAELV